MKKLAAILGFALLTSSLFGETNLHEEVKDYLGTHGLPRLEYFNSHGIILNPNNQTFWYRQNYLLPGNKVFMAEFFPHPLQSDGGSRGYAPLDKGADVYYYDGTWFEDKACDGINGNEGLFQTFDIE